jgi:hypothetical protein
VSGFIKRVGSLDVPAETGKTAVGQIDLDHRETG